jgi:hypothetical protein
MTSAPLIAKLLFTALIINTLTLNGQQDSLHSTFDDSLAHTRLNNRHITLETGPLFCNQQGTVQQP